MKAHCETETATTPPPPAPCRSRDEAEAALAIITLHSIKVFELQTEQNAELARARAYDGRILELQGKIEVQEARLEPWVRAELKPTEGNEGNKAERSVALRHGTVGLRWTKPGVNFLAGVTEDLVLAKLRKLKAWGKTYIRVKESLNKTQVLQDARPECGRLTARQMARLGIEIKRDERFYAEPKIEDVTP